VRRWRTVNHPSRARKTEMSRAVPHVLVGVPLSCAAPATSSRNHVAKRQHGIEHRNVDVLARGRAGCVQIAASAPMVAIAPAPGIADGAKGWLFGRSPGCAHIIGAAHCFADASHGWPLAVRASRPLAPKKPVNGKIDQAGFSADKRE